MYLKVRLGRDYWNWRANLIRIWINIGIFFHMKLWPIAVDKTGIDFWYKGDTVIWCWKKHALGRWISCGFSGTGQFGDARFYNLAELDKQWNEYNSFFAS